jgi:hypothetical protein
MFAERVKEQEKRMKNFRELCSNMNFEKDFEIPIEPPLFSRPRSLLSRLVDYGLTAFLFCTSAFGMCVGALWLLGYLEMWLT